MNVESFNILEKCFKLINKYKSNNEFAKYIYENKMLIKELLSRTLIKKKTKDELINYISEIKHDINDDIEYPDEFLDPILFIPITEPVMIPSIKHIFDRSSILGQLYHEEINPFTREKLTIDEFNNYNKRDEVKKNTDDFKNKIIDWKNSKCVL